MKLKSETIATLSHIVNKVFNDSDTKLIGRQPKVYGRALPDWSIP